ncbi:MAG: SusC/RagA family TonB-linked outer membrane protein [Rikenellaceae bacterium]|jgi:TonB-linked SusC/RagA family outer membrane protein|nr:SusC/RagA family TonB-linked outer membrane protein [Rikenellaceae bacterium]
MENSIYMKGRRSLRRFVISGAALGLLLSAPAAHAQQTAGAATQPKPVTVVGKVVDANGKALAGVSVTGNVATVKTVTNPNGIFVFLLRDEHVTEFTFTFMGMKTRTVDFASRPQHGDWIVTLEEDHLGLDEVVVTGYQELKKHEITGSVKKIAADDLMQSGSFSIDQMLGGRIAGMQVTLGSGEPSATPKIRIRGTSSILGNKAPVWVLDGVVLEDVNPVTNLDLTADDAVYLIGNAISGINPQDIQDIVVLKDAAATSLYGSRAASGVIVVTTKKGKSGAPQVRYNGSVSVSTRENYAQNDLMNASERITLSQEAIANMLPYRRTPTSMVGYEGYLLAFQNKELSYEEFESGVKEMARRNTDWYDVLLRNPVNHNHSLSLSGGDDRTRYYASLGYNNTQGTAIGSGSERYNFSAKLDSWLRANLHVGMNLLASKMKNTGFYSGINPSEWARTTSRTLPLYNRDGSLFYYPAAYSNSSVSGSDLASIDPATTPLVLNYLNELNETGQWTDGQTIDAKLDLQWNIWKGLRYEFLGSYNEGRNVATSWAGERSFTISKIRGYNYNEFPNGSPQYQDSRLSYGGIYQASERRSTTWYAKNSLLYNQTWNRAHQFNAMATSEVKQTLYMGNSITGWGYQKVRGGFYPFYGANTAESPYNTQTMNRLIERMIPKLTDYPVNSVSMLGTAAYTYMDKLIFSGNIRMEGSNSFGDNPKYRFRPIWSLSGKYTLSKEEFMKGLPKIDYLAFRASYGLQGNTPKGSSPFLVAQRGAHYSSLDYDMSTISMLPNPDLRWEKTQSYNVAMDFGLFNGRISGSVDAYRKDASDLLVSMFVTHVNGYQTMMVNGGDMRNSGVDVDLVGYPIRNRDWEVGLGLIFGYNKNVITKVNSEVPEDIAKWSANKVNGNAIIAGYPYGAIWSYRFAGLDSQYGLPIFYAGGLPYSYMKEAYVNLSWRNEEALPDDPDAFMMPNYIPLNDRIDVYYSGSPDPTVTGGLNLNLRYKRLSLNAGFTYALGGVKRLPSFFRDYDLLFDPVYNVSKELNNRWRQPGDEFYTNIPALVPNDIYSQFNLYGSRTRGTALYDKSDIRLAKTDNLRLNSLSVRYRFGDRTMKYVGVKDMAVSFQATNLFLIADKAWKGRDPEQSASANVRLPKTFTLNLDISF